MNNELKQAATTWRVVPEFEDYEINILGDVRTSATQQPLVPAFDVPAGKFYALTGPNLPRGRILMNVVAMVNVAFPESKGN